MRCVTKYLRCMLSDIAVGLLTTCVGAIFITLAREFRSRIDPGRTVQPLWSDVSLSVLGAVVLGCTFMIYLSSRVLEWILKFADWYLTRLLDAATSNAAIRPDVRQSANLMLSILSEIRWAWSWELIMSVLMFIAMVFGVSGLVKEVVRCAELALVTGSTVGGVAGSASGLLVHVGLQRWWPRLLDVCLTGWPKAFCDAVYVPIGITWPISESAVLAGLAGAFLGFTVALLVLVWVARAFPWFRSP